MTLMVTRIWCIVLCAGFAQWHALATPWSLRPVFGRDMKKSSDVNNTSASSVSVLGSDTATRYIHSATAPAPFSFPPNQSIPTSKLSSNGSDSQGHWYSNWGLEFYHKKNSEWCALWDNTCGSNVSLAVDDIFGGPTGMFPAYYCVGNKTEELCDEMGNLGGLKYADAFESWMRSPQCMITSSSWRQKQPHYTRGPEDSDLRTCCDSFCLVYGAGVDLFYWPEPEADDSCLGIVGNSQNAIDAGAMTTTTTIPLDGVAWTTTITYWGCTARSPISGRSFITTAVLSSNSDFTFKRPLLNPWSASDCADFTATWNATRHGNGSWHSPITKKPQTLASTAVVDGTTFTSPSVYARFHNLGYGDICSARSISETLMSFAPGELSTINAPFIDLDHTSPWIPPETKPFNLADLPCPPRSVMEEKWYKPAPGVPYQPLIAAPKQFSSFGGFFSDCSVVYFTALDPPRALTVADAMAPGSEPAECGEECAARGTPRVLTAAVMLPPDNRPTPAPGSTVQALPTATAFAHPSAQSSSQDKQDPAGQDQHAGGNDFKGGDQSTAPESTETDHGPGQQDGGTDESQQGPPGSQLVADGKSFPKIENSAQSGPAPQPAYTPLSSGSHDIPNTANDPWSRPNADDTSGSINSADKSFRISGPAQEPAYKSLSSDPPGITRATEDFPSENTNVGDQVVQLPTANAIGGSASAPVTTLLPDGSQAIVLPFDKKTQNLAHPGSLDDPSTAAVNSVIQFQGALVSAYGTILTAGGPAVTVEPSQSAAAVSTPFVVSLDPNLQLRYASDSSTRPQAHSFVTTPVTTGIGPGVSLVILPSGEGIVIGSTTLLPPPATPSSRASMTLADGTIVSYVNNSVVVLNGTRTVDLSPATIGGTQAGNVGLRSGIAGAGVGQSSATPSSATATSDKVNAYSAGGSKALTPKILPSAVTWTLLVLSLGMW